MSHSLSCVFFHLVWSTKYRYIYFSPEAQKELYRYIHAIALAEDINLIAVGGMLDHIHLLIRVKTNESIERIVRIIKVKTSKFLKKVKGGHECFAWQIGYAKFSVSPCLVKTNKNYIHNQEKHHKKFNFDREMKKMSEPETMGE